MRSFSIITGLFCSLFAVLVAAQQPAVVAIAQGPDEARLQEVVVTAQKREENLQNVPVAVTVLSAEVIENARITSVLDLTSLAPNLAVEAAAGGNGIPSVNIRGIVGGSGVLGVDNPDAIYIDGVYVGDYFGAIQDTADLQRIEVLRGPQGTLFGRNSTGGAINFITAEPTGRLGFKQLLSFGNYDSQRYRTRLDLPEWHNISVQLNYLHDEMHGDVNNLGAGTSWDNSVSTGGQLGVTTASRYLGGVDSDSFHGALKYTPTANLRVDYKFDWSHAENSNPARQVLGFSDGGGGGFSQLVLGAQPGGYTSLISLDRLGSVNNWLSSPNIINNAAHALTIAWQPNEAIAVKDLLSRREDDAGHKSNQIDGAGGLVVTPAINFLCGGPPCNGDPFILLGLGSQLRTDVQWSNELQLNVDTKSFNLVAGYYYFKLDSRDVPNTTVAVFETAPGFEYPGAFAGNSTADIKSNALYSQLTYHATTALDVTGGLRTTWDDKDINQLGVPFPSFKLTHTDWLGNIAYKFDPSLMAYLKASTGFLSGGVTNGVVYKPETVTAYEAGMKADFFNETLRFNAAAFHTDYKDLQFAVLTASQGVLTQNAGKAQIDGVEFESTFIPGRGVNLTANLGYSHFKYVELDPSVGDINTYRAIQRPPLTASVSAAYALVPFGWGGDLSFMVDAQFRSSEYLVAIPITQDPALDLATHPGSRWLLNARVTLSDIRIGSGSAKVSLWGRNLTNDHSLVSANDLGTVVSGTFQQSLTAGADLEIQF